VKPGNLVVPWKDVDEDELKEEAVKKLKKAGIFDPDSTEVEEEIEYPLVTSIVGGTDVVLQWIVGEPGDSVGYIIEAKRAQDPSFYERGSYEDLQTFGELLTAKTYPGHRYSFTDVNQPPGAYTYRVVRRNRAGDVQVVHTADVIVPQSSGFSDGVLYGLFGAAFAVSMLLLSTTGD